MVAPRRLGRRTRRAVDSGGAQHREARAGDAAVGVLERADDARNSRRDDRLGAGRRRAVMRAGLQRHIERRAARRLARLVDGEAFGVRAPARRGDAAPDDDAIAHDQRADRRVGRGEAERRAARSASAAAIQRSSSPARRRPLIAAGRALARRGSRRRRRFGLGLQFADDRVEVARLAEIAIDRGEADIGDVVERLQPLHHEFADPLGRNVGVALALELAHDAVDHALDALGCDGALAQRDLDRAHELVAIERRAPAVFLTTMSSRNCTRSKVVKRPPQSGQMRRRRIEERPRSAANPSPGCRGRRNRGSASDRPLLDPLRRRVQ